MLSSLTSDEIVDDECCVVCYEEDNIIDNFCCDCKFKYHRDCYYEWLKNNGYMCMVCGITIHPNYIDSMNLISDDLLETPDKMSITVDEMNQSLIKKKKKYVICNKLTPDLKKILTIVLFLFLSIILLLLLIYLLKYN